MSKKLIAATVVLCCTSLPAAASVYVCQFNTNQNSYVQEIMAFGLKEDGESAVAFDGLINHFNGGPVDAVVDGSSNKKVSLVWNLKVKDVSQQWARLGYRLAYFKETNRATIRIKPRGYTNEFTANGVCQKSNMTMAQIQRAGRG